MKRWSLLSIPLVGLASITVWAQAVTGAPTSQEPGVIVREPGPRDSVLKDFTETPRLSPLTNPTATPKTSSPAPKSAPLNPATSSPLSTKAAGPAQTGPAPDDPDNSSDVSSDDPGVELVEPAQVTSPAVAPTDDSTSSSELDGKGGLSGNNGLSGTSGLSGRSGSSNE